MQAPINRDLSDKNNAAPFKSSSLYAASIQVASVCVLEVLTTKETVKITQMNILFQYCLKIAHHQNKVTYYFKSLAVVRWWVCWTERFIFFNMQATEKRFTACVLSVMLKVVLRWLEGELWLYVIDLTGILFTYWIRCQCCLQTIG